MPRESVAPTIDAAGAAEVLQRLVTAMSTGDRAAAAAVGWDDTTAERMTDLVDVAEAAQMKDVALRYIDDQGGVAADGTWAATVDAAWLYAGFDSQVTSTEVSVRFVSSEDGVKVAGLGGGALRTPVWMSGPMKVSRSKNLLVVAAASTDLDAYVRLARSAIPTVSRVVTSWRPRLVVEVPVDATALELALGVDPGFYARIAAVTGGGGSLVRGAPIHIYVNPDVYSGLGKVGREVVLAHEVTHLATGAPYSKAPTWLVEGFADYVALRRTGLPLSTTAGQIAMQVRRGALPAALPTAADFDTRGPHLGAVYEASWLLCVVLAERSGPGALKRFYGDVSRGSHFETSLRSRFNWSLANLTRAWRKRLRELV